MKVLTQIFAKDLTATARFWGLPRVGEHGAKYHLSVARQVGGKEIKAEVMHTDQPYTIAPDDTVFIEEYIQTP